jgi:hypothetical protein
MTRKPEAIACEKTPEWVARDHSRRDDVPLGDEHQLQLPEKALESTLDLPPALVAICEPSPRVGLS